MKGILKLITAAALIAVLTSCIDIETSIQMNEDGGGTAAVSYSVSKLVMELGRLGDDDSFSPLPVSETDFLATAAMIPGMEVRSVSVREDETAVNIESEFEFDSAEALSAFFSPGTENGPSLTREGEETVFRYTLFTAAEEISDESMKMVESFFAEDEIILRLRAPSDINSVSLGTVEGNTAVYSATILEIFSENKDILWEVRW